MIVQAVRSLVFYALFLGQTVILALIVGTLTALAPRRRTPLKLCWAIGRYWGKSTQVFLRFIVGIKTEVTGVENLPTGGYMIAAKHQSDWDIFAILPFAPLPAFIAKKQLLDIPFFGWSAKALNTISIDRSRGKGAIPGMIADARTKLVANAQVIIFPEGTRRPPLAEPDYRQGVARLYGALDVPVVPVAVNSGLYWGRNALILWPGTARARFLPAIEPGLTEAAFRAQLAQTIEAATNALILEAADAGLSRPLSPSFRAKLDALRVGSAKPDQTTTY